MSEMSVTPRRSVKAHAIAVASAALTTVLVAFGIIYFYFVSPAASAGPAQPIPFSHRLHVGIKEIDCRFCHNTVEVGRNAGMPPAEKCLYCHQHIIPQHPWIRELHRFAGSGETIPWVKVTYLPDHANFSHQQHITAGVNCADCHGPVEAMDRVYEENRLLMGFCVDCHSQQESRHAILDCLNCHQ